MYTPSKLTDKQRKANERIIKETQTSLVERKRELVAAAVRYAQGSLEKYEAFMAGYEHSRLPH